MPLLPKYQFDEAAYRDENLLSPLFSGANTTLLEAVTQHLHVFSTNHGMSKSALTDVLKTEKRTLPQPNNLPASYKEAKDLIKHLLIPLYKYDVCVNDCVVYRDNTEFAGLQSCPKCKEPRYFNGKVRKSFTYMPLGPRLARWFGTFNLCKLLYAEKISVRGTLTDFVDHYTIHGFKLVVYSKLQRSHYVFHSPYLRMELIRTSTLPAKNPCGH